MRAPPGVLTERLRLESPAAAHADVAFTRFAEPEIYRCMPGEPPASLEKQGKSRVRLDFFANGTRCSLRDPKVESDPTFLRDPKVESDPTFLLLFYDELELE